MEIEMTQPKQKRGFAVMDPEKRREIASRGGRRAHAEGKAHQFTKAEAAIAGAKGGKAAARKRKTQDTEP